MKSKTVLIKNETRYERIPSPETMRLELNYIYDFGHLGGKNYKCKYFWQRWPAPPSDHHFQSFLSLDIDLIVVQIDLDIMIWNFI